VTLTVTDTGGAVAVVSHVLSAAAPGNAPPLADFSVSCTNLACSVDGGASVDTDGVVAGYSWNWGDGTQTTGATSSHSYPAAGPYRITLSATDDDGAAASTGKDVVVTAPPANDPFAADAFARTIAAGWGTADRGGAWSLTGVTSKYSVTAGVASMTAKAGETDAAVLPAVSSSDIDLRVTLTADKLATGNGSYVGLIGRRVGTNTEYQARLRVRADGTVAVVAGTERIADGDRVASGGRAQRCLRCGRSQGDGAGAGDGDVTHHVPDEGVARGGNRADGLAGQHR
jgi:PKD repeat protein